MYVYIIIMIPFFQSRILQGCRKVLAIPLCCATPANPILFQVNQELVASRIIVKVDVVVLVLQVVPQGLHHISTKTYFALILPVYTSNRLK